jgi:hypothetical protein
MHDHDRSSVRGIKPREKCVRGETIRKRVLSKKEEKTERRSCSCTTAPLGRRGRRRRHAHARPDAERGAVDGGVRSAEVVERGAAEAPAGVAGADGARRAVRRARRGHVRRREEQAPREEEDGHDDEEEREERAVRRRRRVGGRRLGGSDVSPRPSDGAGKSVPGRHARCRTRPYPSSAPCPIQTLIPVSITRAPPEPAHAPRFISPKRAPGGPAHSCPSASRKW